MDLLIFALIVLVITGLLLYLVDRLPLDGTFRLIAQALVIIVAIIVIAQRAGFV